MSDSKSDFNYVNRTKTEGPKQSPLFHRQIQKLNILGFKTLNINILKYSTNFQHKLKTVMEFQEKESPCLMIKNPQNKIVKFVTRVPISWEQTSLHDLQIPKYNDSLAESLGKKTRHIGLSKKPSYAQFGDPQLPNQSKQLWVKLCSFNPR